MGDMRPKRQLLGLALLAGLLLLLPDGPLRAVGQFAVNTGAAVAVHLGLRRYQPERRIGWRALEVALLASAVSNIGWGLRLAGTASDTFVLEMVPQVAVYLTLLVAAIWFLAVRRPGRDPDGLLDAGIVLAAGALLIAEWWSGSGMMVNLRQLAAVLFALLMLAVMTVGGRLAFSRDGHSVSIVLLLSAATLALGGNVASALLASPLPRWGDPLWIITSGLVAIAALHPSMVTLGRAETLEVARVSPSPMLALGAALLTSPAVLALHILRADEDGLILAATAGLLAILVLWRMSRLIMARERDRRALLLNERWFQCLLQHAPDVVIVTDGLGSITYVSPAVRRLLGLEPCRCIGRNAIELVYPPDLPQLTCVFQGLGEQGIPVLSFDLRMQHADGSVRWVEAKLSDLRSEPAVGGFVVNLREVTERKALEAKLRHQALHDPLTGLPNRLLFHQRVEESLTRRNGHPLVLAVLFLDIDDFKTINDSLGHTVGDELLQQIAARLTGCLQPDDVAARLGGDEFGVLVGETSDMQEAVSKARRLVDEVARPLSLRGLTLTMHASVGVAFADEGASAASLLRDADVAMYEAKRVGRGNGRVALFDTTLQDSALRRLNLRAELPEALAAQDFFLMYQPIVELDTGRAVGAEALLRWRHPRRGILVPDDFLAVAEDAGLMVAIGRWVLEQACQRAQGWHAHFPDQPLSIAVNLSCTQLNDAAIVQDVQHALERSGLPPACLVLELTEGLLLPDTPATNAAIHGLKELGIRLAVDDFGKGYCSLAYLQRLPVDVLKIDRSFVSHLGRGMQQTKLTKGVVQLARTLDMRIVAEGIEHPEQAAHLRELGCELGQGFLFAAPLHAGDLDDLLANCRGQRLSAPPA